MPCRLSALFLALLFAGAVLTGCRKQSGDDKESAAPHVQVQVKTAPVRVGDVDETVIATGATDIRRQAQLRSPLTGIITAFRFFNGDSVGNRQVIAEVRSRESQASIQGAEELLRTAQTASQKEEAAKALELSKSSSNTVPIRAPFAGVLTGKAKSENEVVSEGDPLATIVDPSSMFFVADVPASMLRQVHVGQRTSMNFSNQPGRTYDGRVYRIEPQVNPNDQTVKVQMAVSGSRPPLEASLFGQATIVVGRREHALLVPASAILKDDETGVTSVMTVQDSIAIKREVRIGSKRDSLVEVTGKGLQPGMPVIIEGNYGLPDSAAVKVER